MVSSVNEVRFWTGDGRRLKLENTLSTKKLWVEIKKKTNETSVIDKIPVISRNLKVPT